MNCQFLYDEQFLPSLPIKVKHMIDDDGECDCNDDGGDFCYDNVDVDYKEQDPNNLSFFGENITLWHADAAERYHGKRLSCQESLDVWRGTL